MIPGALISALFFAARAYSDEVNADSYIKETTSMIENTFRIDNKNPPYFESDKTWRRCISPCWDAAFYGRSQLKSVGKITAYHTIEVEARSFNTNSEKDSTMTLAKSTAITEARTKGWTIGGTFSRGGLDISATHSNTISNSRTETTTVGGLYPCPPLHECRIETWTFHAKIAGVCSYPKPLIDCDGTIDTCATDLRDLPCSRSTDDYWRDHCGRFGFYEANKDREAACEVSSPVNEENGKPRWVTLLISRPLNGTKRSELDLPQTEYRIIGKSS